MARSGRSQTAHASSKTDLNQIKNIQKSTREICATSQTVGPANSNGIWQSSRGYPEVFEGYFMLLGTDGLSEGHTRKITSHGHCRSRGERQQRPWPIASGRGGSLNPQTTLPTNPTHGRDRLPLPSRKRLRAGEPHEATR